MDCKTHLQSCKKKHVKRETQISKKAILPVTAGTFNHDKVFELKWLDSWTNLDALVVPSLQIMKELFVFLQILVIAPKPKGVFFAFCVLFYASSYWGLHRSVRKKKTSTLYKSPGNEMNRRQENVEHHSVQIEMWSPISLVVKSDCTLWRSHYKQRFNVFLVVDVIKCPCISIYFFIQNKLITSNLKKKI